MQHPSRRDVLQCGLWGAGLVAMGLGVDVRGDSAPAEMATIEQANNPTNRSIIYHLADNSTRLKDDDPWFGQNGEGWPRFVQFHQPILRSLGVGMCIRQPLPTKRGVKDGRVLPLHIDGWVQNQDRPIWRDGFLEAMHEIQRHHRAILYVGHPGGDTGEAKFNADGNQLRPWVPSPTLAEALEGQGYDFRLGWERAIIVYDRSGADIAIDAVAAIGFETPYFKAMDLWRVTLEREGRQVFAESPPDLERFPWLAPYQPAATWASFLNRVKHDRWRKYRLPGLVFVQSDLPAGFEVFGEIGGRTSAWHKLMAKRCQQVIEQGGGADAPLRCGGERVR